MKLRHTIGLAGLGLVLAVVMLVRRPPQRLSIRLEKPAGTIDPGKASTVEAHFVLGQVYERLVRANPDGTVVGELASSWTATTDSPGYDFVIREGAQFSDGTPVTADDAARMLKTSIRAGFVRGLDRIEGATAFRRQSTQEVTGIQVLDRRRLRVRLTRNDVRFLRDLWNSKCSVTLARGDGPPLGSGPYQLARSDEAGGRIELVPNPFYPGPKAEFPEVAISAEPAASADILMTPPQKPDDGYVQRTYFAAEVYFLGFNIDNPRVAEAAERHRLAAFLTSDLTSQAFPSRPYQVGGYVALGIFGHSTDLVPSPAAAKPAVPPGEPVVVTTYHPKLLALAKAYCDKLSAHGTPCRFAAKTSPQVHAAKKDNSLQIFFARFAPTSANAEDCLAVFLGGDPLNWFNNGEGDSVGRRFGETYQQVLAIPGDRQKELRDQYRHLDQMVLDEAMARPIAYGAERSIWYRADLVMPPLNTLGIIDLKLSDVHWR